jgi:hypothetical protein
VFAQVAGVSALRVECVGGDDDAVEFPGPAARTVYLAVAAPVAVAVAVAVAVVVVVVVVLVGFGVVVFGDLVEQWDESADLVGLGVDGVLGDDGGLAVDQRGEQV